ncbi:DNA gyrase inhibitor YacG [bacterium]|nr:MAG: DNA gyrase inhibitor YacG [bacterium]
MKAKCPACKKIVEWEGNSWRPFCSERCKMLDFGNWLNEKYRIDAVEDDEEVDTDILPDKGQQ